MRRRKKATVVYDERRIRIEVTPYYEGTTVVVALENGYVHLHITPAGRVVFVNPRRHPGADITFDVDSTVREMLR